MGKERLNQVESKRFQKAMYVQESVSSFVLGATSALFQEYVAFQTKWKSIEEGSTGEVDWC